MMKIMTVSFEYNMDVMTSYRMLEWIEQLFPRRVVSYREIRDSSGRLVEIKVDVNVGGLPWNLGVD